MQASPSHALRVFSANRPRSVNLDFHIKGLAGLRPRGPLLVYRDLIMSFKSSPANSSFVGIDFLTESAIMKVRFQFKENAMKPIRKLFAAIIILSLSVLACNLPSNTSTSQPADLSSAMTLAVQTIQAATQASPTSVPANTAPPAATPSTTTVTVSSPTNCRTGPDPSYPLVLVFQPGATAEVVGKYTASNYWIIQTPTGGTCWLWGAYATVQGNVDALAEMAPPTPSAVAAAPTAVPTSGSGSGSSPSPTPTSKPLVLKPNSY